MVAPIEHPVIYLTGSHNRAVAAAARRRRDIGLLVTPLTPQYLKVADQYPVIAIDNGKFSKTTPFSAENFRSMIHQVAATPALKAKVRFVVAPDEPMNAAATLAEFPKWAAEIRELGLPVAFAAQDGIELMEIPWDLVDVLFLGGSTEWKIGEHITKLLPGAAGRVIPNPNYRPGAEWAWIRMFREAHRRGIPIHMGRVNSGKRVELAEYGLGCSTVDGTFLAFGPNQNLPRLEKWLDVQNRRDDLAIELPLAA